MKQFRVEAAAAALGSLGHESGREHGRPFRADTPFSPFTTALLLPTIALSPQVNAMPLPRPVRTYGLTHFALAVRDPKRSFEFYRAVFGAECVYDDGGFLQAQTPGSRDVLVFERNSRAAGKRGGVTHFGFRLTRARDISRARDAIQAAGGTITDTGEFVPGEPYVFFRDPDGYEVEIWYELPTAIDPRRRPVRKRKLREK